MTRLLKHINLLLIGSLLLLVACGICKNTEPVKSEPEVTEMPRPGSDNTNNIDSLKNMLNQKRLEKNK